MRRLSSTNCGENEEREREREREKERERERGEREGGVWVCIYIYVNTYIYIHIYIYIHLPQRIRFGALSLKEGTRRAGWVARGSELGNLSWGPADWMGGKDGRGPTG